MSGVEYCITCKLSNMHFSLPLPLTSSLHTSSLPILTPSFPLPPTSHPNYPLLYHPYYQQFLPYLTLSCLHIPATSHPNLPNLSLSCLTPLQSPIPTILSSITHTINNSSCNFPYPAYTLPIPVPHPAPHPAGDPLGGAALPHSRMQLWWEGD